MIFHCNECGKYMELSFSPSFCPNCASSMETFPKRDLEIKKRLNHLETRIEYIADIVRNHSIRKGEKL